MYVYIKRHTSYLAFKVAAYIMCRIEIAWSGWNFALDYGHYFQTPIQCWWL